MQKIFTMLWAKKLYLFIGIILLIIFGIVYQNKNKAPDWITEKVSEGSVRQIISVSGTMDATKTAELAFPITGTLGTLAVREGDSVPRGTELATLTHAELLAEYRDAEASLRIKEADLEELIKGLRPEARTVGETEVAIAKEELERVTKEHNDRVTNAERTLLSSDLAARAVDSGNDDIPPTVTGTYTCDPGTYNLTLFRSGSRSGYSYRLSGIESGTYTAYTESPALLGTCGLLIQWDADETYRGGKWIIQIPNIESASYPTNQNAYDLAVTQRANSIDEAGQKLELAENNNRLNLADPRSEALTRGEAYVLQAQARLEKVKAQIEDHVLRAPFDGVITHIESVTGESVGTNPLITMVSNDAYTITALVPEIDITKLYTGQKADVEFDARAGEILPATITFVSPLAREIDGVSYFEATLMLDTSVPWLRSGLNADIDIIIDSRTSVLRIPKRFLIEEAGSYIVLVPNGTETRRVPVSVLFTGNDGFVEITGLTRDDTIIAP